MHSDIQEISTIVSLSNNGKQARFLLKMKELFDQQLSKKSGCSWTFGNYQIIQWHPRRTETLMCFDEMQTDRQTKEGISVQKYTDSQHYSISQCAHSYWWQGEQYDPEINDETRLRSISASITVLRLWSVRNERPHMDPPWGVNGIGLQINSQLPGEVTFDECVNRIRHSTHSRSFRIRFEVRVSWICTSDDSQPE